jgi:hypothetical protein
MAMATRGALRRNFFCRCARLEFLLFCFAFGRMVPQ